MQHLELIIVVILIISQFLILILIIIIKIPIPVDVHEIFLNEPALVVSVHFRFSSQLEGTNRWLELAYLFVGFMNLSSYLAT